MRASTLASSRRSAPKLVDSLGQTCGGDLVLVAEAEPASDCILFAHPGRIVGELEVAEATQNIFFAGLRKFGNH